MSINQFENISWLCHSKTHKIINMVLFTQCCLSYHLDHFQGVRIFLHHSLKQLRKSRNNCKRVPQFMRHRAKKGPLCLLFLDRICDVSCNANIRTSNMGELDFENSFQIIRVNKFDHKFCVPARTLDAQGLPHRDKLCCRSSKELSNAPAKDFYAIW